MLPFSLKFRNCGFGLVGGVDIIECRLEKIRCMTTQNLSELGPRAGPARHYHRMPLLHLTSIEVEPDVAGTGKAMNKSGKLRYEFISVSLN